MLEAATSLGMQHPISVSDYLDPSLGSWQASSDTLTTITSTGPALADSDANFDFNVIDFEPGKAVPLDPSIINGFELDPTDSGSADDLLWNASDFSAFNVGSLGHWLSFPGQLSQSAYGFQVQGGPRPHIPDERFDRVRQCWPTRKADAQSRCQLWNEVVSHPEDNLFSQSNEDNLFAQPDVRALTKNHSASRWKFDEMCRWRVMRSLGVVKSENLNAKNFPSLNTLDLSLDLFFEKFHNFVPFVHVATFDATKTPDLLLASLCSLGLVMLRSPAAKEFLEEHTLTLIARCCQELGATTRQTTAPALLAVLASSYLSIILGIITGKSDTETCQALYLETVATMITHGFFGDDSIQMTEKDVPDDVLAERHGWKIWSRLESTKRLIIAVVMVDAFYSSTLDLPPVVPTKVLNLYLPSDEKLFFAGTEADWRKSMQAGCRVSSSVLECYADQVSLSDRAFSLNSLGLHAIFAAVWIRLSEAHHRLISRNDLSGQGRGLIPYEVYSMDPYAKPVAPFLVNMMQWHGDVLQNSNPHCLIQWNVLCMSLLGNSWMFELGAGRQGAKPAKAALNCIASWANTPAARRACVHAAQIFWICSKRKVSDSMMLPSETGLFQAALLLGLYVLVMKTGSDVPAQPNYYELLADLDWRDVGDVGMGGTEHYADGVCLVPSAAFITNGGCLTFSGIPVSGGYASARRIIVQFANLLEDAGVWRTSEICRILHIMGDVLMEDGVEGSAKSIVAFYNSDVPVV
nr:hypothetical protein LTR18_005619 [Exophiala xenobiotica]